MFPHIKLVSVLQH